MMMMMMGPALGYRITNLLEANRQVEVSCYSLSRYAGGTLTFTPWRNVPTWSAGAHSFVYVIQI